MSKLNFVKEVKCSSEVKIVSAICNDIESYNNTQTSGICVQPYYQRNYKMSTTKASKLIESILMGIKIPSITVAHRDTENGYITNVIDGQQRLTALYKFKNNEFKLSGLETLKFFNGSNYESLEQEHKTKINEYAVDLNGYMCSGDDDKYNELQETLFIRYNTGSTTLTQQEIYNVMYPSTFSAWLDNFVKTKCNTDKTFKKLFAYNETRMTNKAIQNNLYTLIGRMELNLNPTNRGGNSNNKNLMQKFNNMDESTQLEKVNHYTSLLQRLCVLNDIMCSDSKRTIFTLGYFDEGINSTRFNLAFAFIMMPYYEKLSLLPKSKLKGNKEIIKQEIAKIFKETGYFTSSHSTNRKMVDKTCEELDKFVTEFINKIK